MAIPVEVPNLGYTVEECLIAKWRKHKGEHVSAGEVVAEIEMDRTRRIHYDRSGQPARRRSDSRQ